MLSGQCFRQNIFYQWSRDNSAHRKRLLDCVKLLSSADCSISCMWFLIIQSVIFKDNVFDFVYIALVYSQRLLAEIQAPLYKTTHLWGAMYKRFVKFHLLGIQSHFRNFLNIKILKQLFVQFYRFSVSQKNSVCISS